MSYSPGDRLRVKLVWMPIPKIRYPPAPELIAYAPDGYWIGFPREKIMKYKEGDEVTALIVYRREGEYYLAEVVEEGLGFRMNGWYPGKILRGVLDRVRAPSVMGAVDEDGNPIDTCWVCGDVFREDNAEYCTTCWTLKCGNGGHCLCSLTPEARRAVEAEITSLGMWEYGSPRKKKRRH